MDLGYPASSETPMSCFNLMHSSVMEEKPGNIYITSKFYLEVSHFPLTSKLRLIIRALVDIAHIKC